MKGIHQLIGMVEALPPATYTAGTAIGASGTVALDDCHGVAVAYVIGAIGAGTATAALDESATGSTWTSVGAASLIGTAGTIAANTIAELSYIGGLRYIRPSLVVNTGGTVAAAITVLKEPLRKYPG